MRRIRYGKRRCRICGRWVTNNALGRAAHQRSKECVDPRWLAEQRITEFRFQQAYAFAAPAEEIFLTFLREGVYR